MAMVVVVALLFNAVDKVECKRYRQVQSQKSCFAYGLDFKRIRKYINKLVFFA